MRTRPLAVALVLAATVAAAQTPPKAPDMRKEPAVGPVKPYQAPPRGVFSLPNGVQVVVVEDRRFPLVTIRVAARGGKAAVAREDAGLADAMAELLTDGAGGRTAKQIAEEADAIGGEVRASAEQDYVVVSGFALADKAERLLGLISDVALRPDFPPAEVELRRKNMLEELQLERSQPNFLGRLSFYKRVYPGHPYGITQPTEASIARIDEAKLKALHRKVFHPKTGLVVLIGDLSLGDAKRLVAARFGGWTSDAEPAAPAPKVEPASGPRRVYLVDRPGSAQTVLYVGNRAIAEDHPDHFPLLMANQVLGGSFAARLMQDLREKKGYTYGVRSRLLAEVEGGAFGAWLQVRTEVTGPALADLLGHLERIRSSKVTAAEQAQAKNFLAGSFTRRMETQAGVADALTHALLHRLGSDSLDRYVERVQAVTPAQALAAAKAHVKDASAVVIAVGDGAKIREAIQAQSKEPVQLLDLDGEPRP